MDLSKIVAEALAAPIEGMVFCLALIVLVPLFFFVVGTFLRVCFFVIKGE